MPHAVPGPEELDLLGTLADLELEAEGLQLEQRAEDAADLGTVGYADVTLAGRLIASSGREVSLRLAGGLDVSGRVARATEAYLVLDGVVTMLVPADAVVTASGLSDRAAPEGARTVLARLGFPAAVRRLTDLSCLVHLRDGGRTEGVLRRVGKDFLELGGVRGQVVPLSVVAAVQELR